MEKVYGNSMNFFTLKWGDKYYPEYVNRLYGSLVKHYNKPFTLTCYTDDYSGIRDEVQIDNINLLRKYNTDKVFTYEKLILMDFYESGDPLCTENSARVPVAGPARTYVSPEWAGCLQSRAHMLSSHVCSPHVLGAEEPSK